MADAEDLETALCSEQFGSEEARSCLAAADGSLQWEEEDWPWWWRISQAFSQKPEGREGGGRGSPTAASPPLSGLKAVLLPQGFPDSVSPDYLPYQQWDSVQAFASSLSSALSTHAVMLGLGVGNAEASLAAATATWLIKGELDPRSAACCSQPSPPSLWPHCPRIMQSPASPSRSASVLGCDVCVFVGRCVIR
ncbi:RUS1 family protein C16orf58 homolog [Fukomys damarensis]|uniref:RUS1 family protein C16orf58 homolog n=1 Tax=Fukomys damarensis TaxID=885580 RepID=UPI00054000D3|nr:RUS1 family protein C16orf58 homolog [Fukomys damarensis]